MQPTLEGLVRQMGALASLPDTYHRVSGVIDRPGSSAADIAEALASDAALCARLLRLANSAFYGFPRKVDRISQAVVIVGTRQLRDMVVATTAIAQFKGLRSTMFDMRGFWRHCLSCGLVCRGLAARRREPNIERYFVAGLLHEVGTLLLLQTLPDVMPSLFIRQAELATPLAELERKTLGFDHGDAGAALLTAWKLPAVLADVAAFHHAFSTRGRHPIETAAVHVADVIVHALGMAGDGDDVAPALQTSAWDVLGLPLSVVEPVVDESLAMLDETEAVFLESP